MREKNMTVKFLPLGVQDFETMQTANFVYVDKTEHIFKLIAPAQAFYFMSRPRRFGKSLLVSTLGYLFQGRKDLFKGLWIDKNSDWKWEKFPVVKIDFNGIDHNNAEELRKGLLDRIFEISKTYGVELTSTQLSRCFAVLIKKLHSKYKQDVVILVDEYDKPLISHLGKGDKDLEIAKENRDVLKQFFGVLKEQDVSGALRLVFITGVSKFSRVSLFSDLNNLRDLSMNTQFSNLFGYTEEELEKYFSSYVQRLADNLQISQNNCRRDLQLWYNGYRFTKKPDQVYNPFSILNVFQDNEFKNYWFKTGTPSFLVNLIKKYQYSIPEMENLQLDEDSFTTYDLENLRLEALLFQTGYITITDYDEIFYRLGFPNQEVKTSFTKYLYSELVEIRSPSLKDKYRLLAVHLQQQKIDEFINVVNSILAAIPYTHISDQDESYYHTVFYLMVSGSGVLVQTEALTSFGRIDISVEYEDKVYIIELKCNQSAEKAISQIKERKYADKYKASGRSIFLIGINFDTLERNISDWKFERLVEGNLAEQKNKQ